MSPFPVSALVPTLNAAASLPTTLTALRGKVAEIIIADGGSTDGTPDIARASGAQVITAPRGRGPQLRAAAEAASQPWLLALHADTCPGAGWQEAVAGFIARPEAAQQAGYFRFALDDTAPEARRLEAMVAWRCRWLGLPYGDQGLLLPRSLLQRVGGLLPLPLMEDLELALRLRRHCRLRPLGAQLRVDGRRWQQLGVWQTALSNAQLRRAWRRGGSAEELASRYYEVGEKSRR